MARRKRRRYQSSDKLQRIIPPQAIAGRRGRIRLDCHCVSDALADKKKMRNRGEKDV